MKRMTIALIASAQTMLLAGAASADSWLKDPITECEIWSAEEAGAKESATWSGACHDGKAHGLGNLVWYATGELLGTYRGEMRAGKLHGSGQLKLKNEETGKFDTYTGAFVDGDPKGDGVLVTSQGWKLDGTFDGSFDGAAGIAFYETEEGEVYYGDVKDDKRHGLGTLVQGDKDVYFGEFEAGVASGIGFSETADGGQYAGEFKSGAPNGFGSFRAPDDTVYQGRFENGVPDGTVLVTKPDGSSSVETWADGKRSE